MKSHGDTTLINKVSAMDYMLKSNILYESKLDYSSRQLVQAVAGISGSFAKIKSDNKLYFITPKLIDSKKYKVKDVHKMLVVDLMKQKVRNITNDLKTLGIEKESTKQVDEMIVKSMNKIKRNTHPINVVSLGMSQVEGENITLRDEESIAADGENCLAINDNPFAYTQEKREELIVELFDKVKGFSYTSYEEQRLLLINNKELLMQ